MHTQCNRSGFARENSTFCRTGRSASTRARSNAYVHTELQCKHRHAVSLRKINSEFSWTLFGHFSPNRARPHVFSISAGCLECKQKTETGSLMRLFFHVQRKGPALTVCLCACSLQSERSSGWGQQCPQTDVTAIRELDLSLFKSSEVCSDQAAVQMRTKSRKCI